MSVCLLLHIMLHLTIQEGTFKILLEFSCTRMCVYLYYTTTHTHTHTQCHTYVHAHTNTRAHAQAHTYTHTQAHTRTSTHTLELELEASHPEMMLSRGCGHTSLCYCRGRVVVHLCLDMSCLLRKDRWQVVQTNGLSGGGAITC